MAKLTLSFKNNLLKVINVKPGSMTIGRDPSCDIHIDSLAINPVHATLETSNDKTLIKDSDSSEGIFVNHQRINEVELADKDIIRIGKHVLRFSEVSEKIAEEPELPEQSAAAAPAAEAEKPDTSDGRSGWFQILSGKHLGKTIKLKSGMTDLGQHNLPPALISHRDGTYHISSLGDAEIRVADKPIGEKAQPLESGDMIRIGDMQIQFYLQ